MPPDVCLRPWEFATPPFRIVGGLYYVGNTTVSSHLIDTGEGLILLDTAFPQTTYLLLESIRRLGFDPDDIRYILHCHGHYDHFGGTRAIVELTGAKTALGKQDIEIIGERRELSWAPEYGVEFHETFEVDLALSDGDILSLGNVDIECLHIPGHTAGSMAYFWQVETEDGQVTVGIHGGPGLNTLSEDYLACYGLPVSRRSQYLRSLQRLKGREVDVFVGAHPDQNATLQKRAWMREGHNPFLDRTAWPTYLEQLESRARDAFGLPQP